MPKTNTKVITNFTGRLTRIINGDMNSGFAKFSSSWGYDPFSKPGNLTWLYQPDDIKGTAVTDAVLAAKIISPTPGEQYAYAIGNSSKVYRIDPTNSGSGNTPLFDTPSVIAAIGSVSGTFNYGGDIDYYRSKLHVSSDSTITTLNLDGSSPTLVSGSSSITAALQHPLIQFQGSLFYGNGNNIGQIDSTGIIVNGAKLSPALPVGMYINDLDVTPDGTYMIITASYIYPNQMNSPVSAARGKSYAVDSYIFFWNGTDTGITSFQSLPSFPATALNTFMDKRYFFNQDAFGTALYEGNTKLLTLPNNVATMPNGATPNGTFLTWVSPEGTGTVNSSSGNYTNTYTSLYYYGQLDAENPPGLWRMIRQSPSASNAAYRAPLNMMVNNFDSNLNAVSGWGKHYISVWEFNSGGSSSTYHFYRFVLPPAANTAPTLGVYETQNELYSKKTGVAQIRVYCEPTVAGNSFQLDMISGDGTVVTNGSFTYTFAAGTDSTQLQGAMERINFNPNTKTLYSLGIRVTNTGTSNMTIKKIEIDWSPEGK